MEVELTQAATDHSAAEAVGSTLADAATLPADASPCAAAGQQPGQNMQ